MNISNQLKQISICYNKEFICNENMLNYENYNIQNSIKYFRKIENLCNSDRRCIELELAILEKELNSGNPFYIQDLYTLIVTGIDLFEFFTDEDLRYSTKLRELDSLIPRVAMYIKNENIVRTLETIKEIKIKIFQIIKQGKLMEDRNSLDYIVIKNKNLVYLVHKNGHITKNELTLGGYNFEYMCNYDKTLNELDRLIDFNKAALRISSVT